MFYFTSDNDQSLNRLKVFPIDLGVIDGFRYILFLSLCVFFFTVHKVVVIITHILTEVKHAIITVRMNFLKANLNVLPFVANEF